jgi:hypothetical protein
MPFVLTAETPRGGNADWVEEVVPTPVIDTVVDSMLTYQVGTLYPNKGGAVLARGDGWFNAATPPTITGDVSIAVLESAALGLQYIHIEASDADPVGCSLNVSANAPEVTPTGSPIGSVVANFPDGPVLGTLHVIGFGALTGIGGAAPAAFFADSGGFGDPEFALYYANGTDPLATTPTTVVVDPTLIYEFRITFEPDGSLTGQIFSWGAFASAVRTTKTLLWETNIVSTDVPTLGNGAIFAPSIIVGSFAGDSSVNIFYVRCINRPALG